MTDTHPDPAAPAPQPAKNLAGQALAVFRFFASLKLALILLAVLIVGLAGGTIVESQRSAAFAKAQVYDAPWFSLWLAFLIINLTCAALIRYPWKPHLTGFVITHAGIIVMLLGAKVGQVTGVEGGMDLHTDGGPKHLLEKFDDQWIDVGLPAVGRVHRFPFSIPVDRPRPDRPIEYHVDEDNLTVRVLDLQPVEPTVISVPVPPAAAQPEDLPALHFSFQSPVMQRAAVDEWLRLGERIAPMGLIEFRFLRGVAPQPAASAAPAGAAAQPGAGPQKVRSMERFFFFRTAGMGLMKSGQQIGPDSQLDGHFEYTDGGAAASSSAKLQLKLNGQDFDLIISGKEGQELPLAGTPYSVYVEKVFRNLHVGPGGAEDTVEGPAQNPAALIKLYGPLVDPGSTPAAGSSPHGGGGPKMGLSNQPKDQLYFYLGSDQRVTYWMHSATRGEKSGVLEVGHPVELGWAGLTLDLKAFFPHARQLQYFKPLVGETYDPDKPEGLRAGLLCEVEYNGARQQVWIGSQRRERILPQPVLCNGQTVNLQLGAQTVDLGFDVSLRRFEVPRNEGTMDPADFRSTLEIGPPAGPDGAASKEVSQIYMNNPTNYPNNLVGAYLGTSYKFSQANHNPEDPTYSGVQILRDPGWMPKWVGALMISFGIFTMFYLKPYFHGRKLAAAEEDWGDPAATAQQAANAQKAAAILQRARAPQASPPPRSDPPTAV